MQDTQLPPLDEYVDLHALHAHVQQSLPTEHSVRWFVRRNRDALAAAGGIIIVAGRMLFHPDKFKQATVEIGQKAAA